MALGRFHGRPKKKQRKMGVRSGLQLYLGRLIFSSSLLHLQVGLLSAYIMKKLYLGRHSTDREVALMILMAYLSYMVAEVRF